MDNIYFLLYLGIGWCFVSINNILDVGDVDDVDVSGKDYYVFLIKIVLFIFWVTWGVIFMLVILSFFFIFSAFVWMTILFCCSVYCSWVVIKCYVRTLLFFLIICSNELEGWEKFATFCRLFFAFSVQLKAISRELWASLMILFIMVLSVWLLRLTMPLLHGDSAAAVLMLIPI